MEIRADSTEYATATVGANTDITGDTIEVSLPISGDEPVTWILAEVPSVVVQTPGQWLATYRILLGPNGSKTLTKGTTYDWFVRVTDSPEIPVRLAGTVTAT